MTVNWNRDGLLHFLEQHAIGYQEVRHDAVYTMAESAMLNLALPGCRCKNLLVQAKKGVDRFLVVTPPDASVDLGALGRLLGVGRLSLCPPEEMMHLLGVSPGAMSPLALVADMEAGKVKLMMDASLYAASHFLFHPLDNSSTVTVSSDGLQRFLAATGHSLEFIDIPRRETRASADS